MFYHFSMVCRRDMGPLAYKRSFQEVFRPRVVFSRVHYNVKSFFEITFGTKNPGSDEEVHQKNDPCQVSSGLDGSRQTR